jgi:hypothetical protein
MIFALSWSTFGSMEEVYYLEIVHSGFYAESCLDGKRADNVHSMARGM